MITMVHCWRTLKTMYLLHSSLPLQLYVLSAANKLQRLALCAFILRFDKIMSRVCPFIHIIY